MATTKLTGILIKTGSIPTAALGGGVISSSTSFATTGSNSFIGNQNINGTVYLTGSLIPSGNFLYDLGSETNSFRDLFISTGSIRFHNPDGTEQGRITVDARSGDISLLKTAGLTNEQKATISQGNINPDFLTAVSASNLFVQTKIVMPIGGTVNGINLTAFSSSVASTLSNQSAATSSYAINSTIQGQLAGVVSSSTQVKPLLPGGTVTSSAQYPGWITASSQVDYNSITNKLSGVVSSSTQVPPLLPGGTVSSSGQVLLNTVSGTTFSNTAFYFPLDVRVEGNLTAQQIYTEYVSSSVIYESGSTKFGDTTDDVMSVTGSIRVLGGSISGSMTGMFSASSQVDYNSITNKLSGVVSSSAQVAPLLPGGTVSASGQVDYNSITNKLSGVVSASAQVAPLLPGGTVSSSAQVITGVAAQTIAPSIINATGVISGASIQTSGNGILLGNVGIGTTSPTSTLHVVGTATISSTLGVTGVLTATGGVVGNLTGNASTATALATARAINGTNFDGTAAITVTAAAGTLTGATLASGVTASSLTSVGTLTSLAVSGNLTVDTNTLFVDATNNRVGVGLTTPAETLDVKGTGNFNAVGGTYVGFQHNGTTVGYAATANAVFSGGATTNFALAAVNNLVFGIGSAEKARIDASGNLLVGGTTAYGLLTLGSTAATASGIAQLTTATTFLITPSNTAAGGVLVDTGWVAGGQGPLRFAMSSTEVARIDASGNFGIGVTRPSASLHVSGTMMIQGVIERVNVTGSAPPSTLNVDAISGSVFYLSGSSANNWTINFRGSAATSLNSMMYPGQSMTFAVLVNHASVGYTASAHQVDGVSITPRWQGGTVPSGSGTSTDIYSYTLIKTANAAFNIFAAQTKFA